MRVFCTRGWIASVALLLGACSSRDPVTLPDVIPPEIGPIPPGIPVYDRDSWRYGLDLDGDCQDTRAEVLIRDSLQPVRFRPREDGRSCVVDTGLWVDPYSGATFTQAAALEVDHMVSLANAHRSGGWSWSGLRKQDYANDLTDARHLRPVTASLNRAKSDRGPEQWLPPNPSHLCSYVRDWRAIKQRWQLSMTRDEAGALLEILLRCK